MPPRRSQRLAGPSTQPAPAKAPRKRQVAVVKKDLTPIIKRPVKRARLATPEEEDDDADEGNEEEEYQDEDDDYGMNRPKRRGMRGILQKMTDTHILVLEPLDLLRMSRTTKDLRQLLMSRSTAFVGLPPMLEDLSEPQYANLLFDTHCHECGKCPTKYVQWEARIRLCKSCLDDGTIMSPDLSLYTMSTRATELLAVTPQYRLTVNTGRRGRRQRYIYYHVPSYRELIEVSAQEASFSTWYSQEKREYMAMSAVAELYQQWSLVRTNDRTEELAALRKERLSGIMERLEADGWGEELKDSASMKTLRQHKLVNQPRALTDRIWHNIRDTLTEVMTTLRAELLAEKIRTAIPRRTRLVTQLCGPILRKMPEVPACPEGSMLSQMEPFSGIINSTPLSEDVTADDFAEGLEMLPDLCASWRKELEDYLKEKLSEAGCSEDLSLVANAFACSKCHYAHAIHYPYFASHGCVYPRTWMLNNIEVTRCAYEKIKLADPNIRAQCEEIIKMCGLEPATATAEDMDSADAFFRCEECFQQQYQYAGYTVSNLMRWRVAMCHYEKHLPNIQRVTDAALISGAQTDEERTLRSEIKSTWSSKSFVCMHCNVADSTEEARAEHLLIVHNLTGDSTHHYKRSLREGGIISQTCRVEIAKEPTPPPEVPTEVQAQPQAEGDTPTHTLLDEVKAENSEGITSYDDNEDMYVALSAAAAAAATSESAL
ncbi:hypothetical protein BDZ89DRAFT_1072680 [Hymenopellis radicata]|nr:hypothetical protein BDZ89DRAFT_1072680 [Hymenopellis radicata]